MKNLATSTALAIVLAFGGGASFATSAVAQEAAACSDFGLIDADDNDVLSEAEYSAWNGGVFDDWDDDDDGLLSETEFDNCFEAGGWYEGELGDGWEEDADELYAAWADDDDGLLSDDEFADEEEFAEWDDDDDGDVDDQEFLIDNFLF